jgi:predicted nucleotidyltransferase
MRDLPNFITTVNEIRDRLYKSGSCAKLVHLVISGSDLYGFSSVDSDIDYRGAFFTHTPIVLGLRITPDSFITNFTDQEGRLVEVELFEIKKLCGLLIKMNCNVLEHIFAPPLESTSEFLTLRELTRKMLAKKGTYDSYKGMATFNYKKFILTGKKKTVKKYLYVARALMAGIYFLENNTIQPNIVELGKYLKEYNIIDQLVGAKQDGYEESFLAADIPEKGIESSLNSLYERLDTAYTKCNLPELVSSEDYLKLNNFVVKTRKNF